VQKKTDGLAVFFAFLGSSQVKSAREMLVKSAPDVVHKCRHKPPPLEASDVMDDP